MDSAKDLYIVNISRDSFAKCLRKNGDKEPDEVDKDI